jgi:hypothetical protein
VVSTSTYLSVVVLALVVKYVIQVVLVASWGFEPQSTDLRNLHPEPLDDDAIGGSCQSRTDRLVLCRHYPCRLGKEPLDQMTGIEPVISTLARLRITALLHLDELAVVCCSTPVVYGVLSRFARGLSNDFQLIFKRFLFSVLGSLEFGCR